MFCKNCGAQVPDGASFCMKCGASQNVQEVPQNFPVQQPVQGTVPAANQPMPEQQGPAVQTKKEFIKLPENKRIRYEILSDAILCYIWAAILLVGGLAEAEYFGLALVCAVVCLVSGLFIQLKYSRAAAIVMTVFGVLDFLGSIGTDDLSFMLLVWGIFAIVYTFKAEKLWNAYKASHGMK